jgi:hypothetical protein
LVDQEVDGDGKEDGNGKGKELLPADSKVVGDGTDDGEGNGKEALVDSKVDCDGVGNAGERDGGDSGGDLEGEGGDGERDMGVNTSREEELEVYRVVNKVKGLWEIMEAVPQQSFVFT